MKRLSLFTLILLALSVFSALPTLAQTDPNVITLNDASPVIDVVITLPPDTTGTIALDFSGAAVLLTDATGNVVFSTADDRLHGLELNIAPNSGSHTLTVERLPGVTEALVRVTSLPELSAYGSVELIPGLALTSSQEVSLALNADHPGDTVNLSLPGNSAGMVTATFPGAGATAQLVDATGVLVVEATGGHVDGMNLLLDAGEYQFTLLGNGLSDNVVAGVRLVSADDAGIAVMQAPVTSPEVAVAADVTNCTAVVTVSSTNLRSGPGTGYTVLGYGYRDQVFTVGGRNPEDNWVLVGVSDTSSAWVARTNVQLQGGCTTLTTYNIPLQDAQPAPLVITVPGGTGGTGGAYYGDDDEHDDDEHEEHEEHDDDDEGDDD